MNRDLKRADQDFKEERDINAMNAKLVQQYEKTIRQLAEDAELVIAYSLPKHPRHNESLATVVEDSLFLKITVAQARAKMFKDIQAKFANIKKGCLNV